MNAKPCRRCKAPVIVARKAEYASGKPQGITVSEWAVVDADTIDPSRVLDIRHVRAISGRLAWKIDHLRESIQLRREVALTSAIETAAEDFVWHPIHRCGGVDK